MSERGRKFRRSRLSSGESDISDLSSSFSSPFSSDDEVDAKDLKSIKEYVNNRKELVSQMFKAMTHKSISRMLPNELRNIDFEQLKELCINELIGMSGTRIKCIIDKREMLQSSDTDSDDSGPSLEIVSDTELISDDDLIIKEEEPKNTTDKKKKKSQSSKSKSKKNEKLNKNSKTNIKIKNEKIKSEKIKTEKKDKEKGKEKGKDGENLLDLLELEMRARAIRALIRKEETTSTVVSGPTNNSTASTSSGSKTVIDSASKVRQNQLKEQLEKIDVLMEKHGDDEDLFIVINPAPTIELISSEDENDLMGEKDKSSISSSKKVNQEQNEKSITKTNNNEIEGMPESSNNNQDSQKEKGTDKTSDPKEKIDADINLNLPISVTESMEVDGTSVSVEKPMDLEDGEICDEDENVQVTLDSLKDTPNVVSKTDSEKMKKINSEKRSNQDLESGKKIKKVKKNPHIRSPQKISKKSMNSADTSIKSSKSTKKIKHDEPIEIPDSPENLKEIKEEIFDDMELDKALDNIQEIINLDDYPDDEDDENMSNINNQSNNTPPETEQKNEDEGSMTSETWATRYYQKDEVQSVIKESKMQSEIRKRLRERQRQIKLKPKPLIQENSEQNSVQPIGSVEEYLSLKGISNAKNEKDAENTPEKDLPLEENKSLEEVSTPETEQRDDTPEIEKKIVFTSKPMLSISSEKTVDSKNITVETVAKILGDSVSNEIQTTSNQPCEIENLNEEKPVKVYPRIIEDIYISNVNIKTDCTEEINNEVSKIESEQDLKQS
ncbi:protein starmaker-like [Trichogramma pretiosum]|uniref:protein starmaker-like n=1 Tax=Trichogramma pretiosum TaxID=7493 RepID=UPI0006C99963|nr:protein starmaker-like [Trichogramma pretiosum]